MTLSTFGEGDDSHWNRTYVGTWEIYSKKLKMKCIWGDGRLPFIFDFDVGEGDCVVNEKHLKNGWNSLDTQEQWWMK